MKVSVSAHFARTSLLKGSVVMPWNCKQMTKFSLMFAVPLMCLLGGCAKSERPKKKLDEATRNSLKSLQKRPAMTGTKSARALELFQAQQAAYALIGGNLAEE